MIRSSSPSSLISVPEYLPKRIWSPALTSSGKTLPSSFDLPLPTGDHLALLRLLLGGVRDDDAATDAFALFHAADQNAIMRRCQMSSPLLLSLFHVVPDREPLPG